MFDFKPFEFTIVPGQNPPWNMDVRHIKVLYDLAMKLPAGSDVAEIGSYRGASTSAFIQAINDGAQIYFHAIEPRPTPELEKVLSMAKYHAGVSLVPTTSTKVAFMEGKMLLIDGDHGWPAIYEVGMALALEIPIIVMHDTNRDQDVYKEAHGSWLAADILRKCTNRFFVEDKEKRVGEFTERGLIISVKKGWEECLPKSWD